MKNLILIFFVFISINSLNAQVGIGNTDPKAVLDISASSVATPAANDGILIPRVSAFPATNPGVAQNGMMVFKTVASTGFPIGFYFWNNATTSWNKIDNGNGDYWKLTGNAGTNAATNFIGTTDNNDIVFKRNSIISGRIAADNTSFGTGALNNISSGTDNIAIGSNALNNITTGGGNVAIGSNTLSLAAGTSNIVAIGRDALLNNTASANVAIGFNALKANTDKESNTAIGYSALEHSTGQYNTAVGRDALEANTSGVNNTAVGYHVLEKNTSGENNVALGYYAGRVITTGERNTFVGADTDAGGSGRNNATAIGYGAVVSNSNKIRLGNASVTVIEGQVTYTFPSDARFKFNVKENVPGLDFIKKLKPVTYNFDTQKFAKHVSANIQDREDSTDYSISTNIIHTGFLAQDIEKICKELGYDFDGIHIPDASNPTDNYSVGYSQFIMPIVKAIQEQQTIIENQKIEIQKLKEQNERFKDLENRLKALESK